jgi:hypothetical protein
MGSLARAFQLVELQRHVYTAIFRRHKRIKQWPDA